MPLYPQKPYLSLCLFRWSCGGQECPDGVPECHNQKANCLRSILSFYRPQKAFWTPKIWLCESCVQKGDFSPIFLPYPILNIVWKAPAKRVLAYSRTRYRSSLVARCVLRGPYKSYNILFLPYFSKPKLEYTCSFLVHDWWQTISPIVSQSLTPSLSLWAELCLMEGLLSRVEHFINVVEKVVS